MILSVSRRTDIPAYHMDWFFERLRAGECQVRNPRRPDQVSRIILTPAAIDAIVFWTRDPRQLIRRQGELHALGFERYYVMITLTGYGARWEPGELPENEAVTAFQRLADKIGPARVTWRYDPIIMSRRMNGSFHAKNFSAFASRLRGSTERVIVSLLDEYARINKRIAATAIATGDVLAPSQLTAPGLAELLKTMACASADAGMTIQSCAENAPVFRENTIEPGACIDPVLLNRLFGLHVPERKDPGQRVDCLCGIARDIGAFNTCSRNCAYCYANWDRRPDRLHADDDGSPHQIARREQAGG